MPDRSVFDILTVVGNRPQFIKMGPLSAELRSRGYREYVVHTGQHFDDNMSDVFFKELDLPTPDINLDISSGSHGEMTGRMLIRLEQVFLETKPRCVILFGDTNSTLAAALAAVKLHIPFAHVESGPRIFDMTSPEEVNRLVADIASTLRFCPDELSVKNLAAEAITKGVYFSGDVMYDAYQRYSKTAAARSDVLKRLNLLDSDYALLTVHRPNNTDSPESARRLMELFTKSPMKIAFPAHPRTENACKRHGLWDAICKMPNVAVFPAVGYLDSLQLINHATVVLTDSGGLQKEAFFAGKPCITLFTTPWPMIEQAGWQITAWRDGGIDTPFLLKQMSEFRPTSKRPDLFGDGRAAKKIVDTMESHGWLESHTR
ncbi:MAG: UDP-N-acetylglucosamine 2-epimerase (non-hydrolyzing) [Planctomycetes bacterium]|nr:UDP-N-acetylglucosamine 2-epimerase (non-hydrolyzing) [Planctomycetota bacterium]